ncbi:hypothetical protein LB505_000090 [Fusarium chuoi]|nr:hypothetical protein LB505_000090 [Fusarium chuoi]
MIDSAHLSGRDDLSIIVAPGPGTITTPSLTANLVCRVLFGLIANIACIVPLKNLYRNGEFAAVVFIANIECGGMARYSAISMPTTSASLAPYSEPASWPSCGILPSKSASFVPMPSQFGRNAGVT